MKAHCMLCSNSYLHLLIMRMNIFWGDLTDILANNKGTAVQALFMQSETMPEGTPIIAGHDFNGGRSLDDIMAAMLTSGFQASNLGQAVSIVNEMVRS